MSWLSLLFASGLPLTVVVLLLLASERGICTFFGHLGSLPGFIFSCRRQDCRRHPRRVIAILSHVRYLALLELGSFSCLVEASVSQLRMTCGEDLLRNPYFRFALLVVVLVVVLCFFGSGFLPRLLFF